MTINILISLLLFMLITLFIYKLNHPEKFTMYDNFEYSDKLSVSDIKNLKEGQFKMGKMLKEFDIICQKHNIRYFLDGGSLIGLLKYGGWIPWDGDIDLQVHEDDYAKLKKVLKTELPKNMWFQNNEVDKFYSKNNIVTGKIRDLNSCYIEYTNNGGTSWHNGLQLDIVLYKENNNYILLPHDKRKYNLTYDDIYPLQRVPFENGTDIFNVNVMKNPDKYLNKKYSKNWKKILPKNKRYPHEGKIDGYNTCKFHYDKYPKLHSKSN